MLRGRLPHWGCRCPPESRTPPSGSPGPWRLRSAGFPGSLAPAGSDHGPAGHRELCSAGAIPFRDAGEAEGLVEMTGMFHVLFGVQV